MEPEFDRYARSYEKLLAEAMPGGLAEDGYFARYKVEVMARALRGRPIASVLDFGCGVGRSLPYLRAAFPEAALHGFDESRESVAIARRAMPGATLVSDWSALPRGRFDAILAANVFHHIDPAGHVPWLARCREMLAPDGRLFVFEHNPANPATRWVFERCAFDVGARMIRRADALAAVREAGLVARGGGYSLFFPKPVAFLRGTEPLLRWLPLGAQYFIEASR